MSSFVREHVKRVFHEAGYGLLKVDGDRGGIVQGDGLRIVVAPYIKAAARRFGADDATVEDIVELATASRPFKFELYGGSVSIDLEGVYLPHGLIAFMKDECRETYYQAQREINAIFAAEDPPNKDWDEGRRAYIGTVDEFPAETPDGDRVFVRVRRIADQSFNAYESGEAEADAKDVRDILDGSSSHGSVEVEVYEIEPDGYDENDRPKYYAALSRDAYNPRNFTQAMAKTVYADAGLIWPRDKTGAQTVALAADIVADEGNDRLADILQARAVALGLPTQDNSVANSGGLKR